MPRYPKCHVFICDCSIKLSKDSNRDRSYLLYLLELVLNGTCYDSDMFASIFTTARCSYINMPNARIGKEDFPISNSVTKPSSTIRRLTTRMHRLRWPFVPVARITPLRIVSLCVSMVVVFVLRFALIDRNVSRSRRPSQRLRILDVLADKFSSLGTISNLLDQDMAPHHRRSTPLQHTNTVTRATSRRLTCTAAPTVSVPRGQNCWRPCLEEVGSALTPLT